MNTTGSKHYVWIPLIGFDREQSDQGVDELFNRMGYIPEAVSVFLFHADIVHLHNGVENVRKLPPDNCSYYGSLRNEERERQDWTNIDLKNLVGNLNKKGTKPLLGIMGVSTDNARHNEWYSNHPELLTRIAGRNNVNLYSLHVLKRFKDGTYYEDYFADKICEVLNDYDFAGLHVSDNFCPPPQSGISYLDYSVDMVEQFISDTGAKLPQDLITEMNCDSDEAIIRRRNFIWNNLRQEWIEFYVRRWNRFWKKVCNRIHAIGKVVIVNNSWCTEPFESIYRYGIDYRGIIDAGVDCLIPETVPNGTLLNDKTDNPIWRYHQYMTMSMFMGIYAPHGDYRCLLGVKDVTEEWDVLHHAMPLLERDIYTLSSYLCYNNEGNLKRCSDGFMICLGDGIRADEWEWLRERFDVAYKETPQRVIAPTIVWSDAAMHALLPDYIRNRRYTSHKYCYELAKRGAIMTSVGRIEDIEKFNGTLFIPNFDLMPYEEQMSVVNYKNGPVICIASTTNGFTPESLGIVPDFSFVDPWAEYKECVFVLGMKDINREEIFSVLSVCDDSPEFSCEPMYMRDPRQFREEMVFTKVSDSFLRALVLLISNSEKFQFKVKKASCITMDMGDGRYRLHIVNDDLNRYVGAEIAAPGPIKCIDIISKYPVLPPNMISPDTFIGRVTPGGLSIFDVTLEN